MRTIDLLQSQKVPRVADISRASHAGTAFSCRPECDTLGLLFAHEVTHRKCAPYSQRYQQNFSLAVNLNMFH